MSDTTKLNDLISNCLVTISYLMKNLKTVGTSNKNILYNKCYAGANRLSGFVQDTQKTILSNTKTVLFGKIGYWIFYTRKKPVCVSPFGSTSAFVFGIDYSNIFLKCEYPRKLYIA